MRKYINIFGLFLFNIIVKIMIFVFDSFRKLKSLRYLTKTFHCIRCGGCCSYKVKTTNQEIEDISRLGFKKDEFIETIFGVNFIKIVNGKCYFFEGADLSKNSRQKNEYMPVCKIYKNRPKICQKYPIKGFLGAKGKDHRCRGIS